jgi:Flp pilus assembly protein TadG
MGLADAALHGAAALGVLTSAVRRHTTAMRRAAPAARAPLARSTPNGHSLDEDIRRGRASATLTTLRRRVPTPRR